MCDSKLTGPFKQIITMVGLPLEGPISDNNMNIIPDAGIVSHNGKIKMVGAFRELRKSVGKHQIEEVTEDLVVIPGLIDAHTHLCYGGDRSKDYALRISGESYQTILAKGGGIHETVRKTRQATKNELKQSLSKRVVRHLSEGVTTIEVKSGYGLQVEEEIKMLEAINEVNQEFAADLIPTCLAAHVCPPEFNNVIDYLNYLKSDLLPGVLKKKLSNRVDIFIEDNAFPIVPSLDYLKTANSLGFDITIHADQFSVGGSHVAAEINAKSADHLEASGREEIKLLVKNKVACVVLPGASMGLGMPFAPARDILNLGGILVIATDWNPGSAPMGDLMMQAAVLSASQKLSTAETLAALTFRAAHALGLSGRGRLVTGQLADYIGFPVSDYQEILYNQGKFKPTNVWKSGNQLDI